MTSHTTTMKAHRTASFLRGLACATGLLTCCGSAFAGDRIPLVERTMRRLQTRIYAIERQHVEWPDCCEGSKTPPYPKNKYFDSALDGNEELALDLVKFIHEKFYERLPYIAGEYLKDGLDTIGPDNPPYAAPRFVFPGGPGNPADFDVLPEPTMDDYPEILAALDAEILRLDSFLALPSQLDTSQRVLENCYDCQSADEELECGENRDIALADAASQLSAWTPMGPSALGMSESHKAGGGGWAT